MLNDQPATFDDLLLSFDWVSGNPGENCAYISRSTGRIYWSGPYVDEEEDLPEDLEENPDYVLLPEKRELDLGRELVMSFTEVAMPRQCDEVVQIFRRRGAYQKFKALLSRHGKLDAWYKFENDAVERALKQWLAENDLSLPSSRPAE